MSRVPVVALSADTAGSRLSGFRACERGVSNGSSDDSGDSRVLGGPDWRRGGRHRQSRKTTLSRELLIFKPPLYSMNPSFRNLFMKKFTRERVVPTISASVSCDTLGSVR